MPLRRRRSLLSGLTCWSSWHYDAVPRRRLSLAAEQASRRRYDYTSREMATLTDESPQGRRIAAIALGKRGGAGAVAALRDAVDREQVTWVRASVILALGKLGGEEARAEHAIVSRTRATSSGFIRVNTLDASLANSPRDMPKMSSIPEEAETMQSVPSARSRHA